MIERAVRNLVPIQTIRWLVAIATFFVATIQLLYGPSRLEYPAPFYISHIAMIIDTVVLAATFYASIGLIIGRRVAWGAAVVILLIAMVWDTLESKGVVSALSLLPLICLAILFITRDYYPFATGRTPAFHLLRRVLLLTFMSTIVMVVVSFLVARTGHLTFTLTKSVIESLDHMYQPQDITEPLPYIHHENLVLHVLLPLFGTINYILISFALLRPVADHFSHTPASQREVLDLLELYGTTSEDYFKYFPHDKSYFFSKEVRGFIAYGVSEGICIAIADPVAKTIADKQRLSGEFITYCLGRGWQVAFLAVDEENKDIYRRVGLKLTKIGENAQIDIAQYMEGSLEKNARNIRNRFKKAGYRASFVDSSDHTVMNELRQVSESWLEGGGRHRERTFLMGYFDEPYLKQCDVYVVRDEKNKIVAFVNMQPNYSRHKHASIDLMRSSKTAPANTMDFLFISLIQRLYEDKWISLDLGLAPLSGLEERRNLNERGLHLLYLHANRWFSFRGLRRFKNKFQPVWEPRYVAYSGSRVRLPMMMRALSELMSYKK